MGKNKLKKFAEMETFSNVFQCGIQDLETSGVKQMAGHWRENYFKNENPIVLELGCGRGEYTVGLAERNPEKNYIGIDIKGARMWAGAKQAELAGMKNVAFLRINIEMLCEFFASNEVDEIWITFPDPQMKKVTKRLTSTYFMERYRHFLADKGLVHLKTDSNFLFTYTEEMLKANNLPAEVCTRNLYAEEGEETLEARSFQTYYEGMWRDRGIDIKYLRFRLPQDGKLEEPDVEIPLDEYRSYNRSKRSGKETAK